LVHEGPSFHIFKHARLNPASGMTVHGIKVTSSMSRSGQYSVHRLAEEKILLGLTTFCDLYDGTRRRGGCKKQRRRCANASQFHCVWIM